MKLLRPSNPRRAFLLLQMLMTIPLLAIVIIFVLSGFKLQFKAQRRISEHANRQTVMRSVLDWLRADLADARRVEFEILDGNEVNPVPDRKQIAARYHDLRANFPLVRSRCLSGLLLLPAPSGIPSRILTLILARYDAPTSESADPPTWCFRLDLPGGPVRYRLFDRRQPTNDAGAARIWSIPQTCTREGAQGDVYEWRLCGQTLDCRPFTQAPDRALVVCFSSRLAAGAGIEAYDVFETTLLAGGDDDAAKR